MSEIQNDPLKVTKDDLETLVADIKTYIDILGPEHPLRPTIHLSNSLVNAIKPKVNFTVNKKTRANYTSTETVNYVLGDTDGTWEKCVDWRRRLNIEAQRQETNLKRAADILERVGVDDITWLVQYAIPRKLIKGINYQEEA